MDIFRTKAKMAEDGSLTIKDLPFNKGEQVNVIVQRHRNNDPTHARYPLRGTLLKYEQPFSSVDEDEWDALG